ncbi:response regulator transcription factor [Macrococcus brunensis]|uniref:Response regulator transcription factor n=1 Tax=Macrococcus brunensis TaxID=198483 RepID=A0A4R6BE62_9STAP|nr:response regulator transcription factor [Macrococcus brunensis]TDL98039.1 response regulator transcription factor [Macrococcus brunensis]ULG72326.1 response regulator transcription factor [Macrococcus brunensis]ULG74586.1 response regulator transcription factor [Macrococcus brunensis]
MKLLIVEDQSMLREAMIQLLKISGRFSDVRGAGNGEEAVRLLDDSYDVVITDIEMPTMNGIELLAYIRKKQFDCKVIIVTTFKRAGYFEKSLNLDVDAYVLKERSVDELIETVDKVTKGQKEFSPELMPLMLTKNPLNDKEQEILVLIGKGLTSKEISQQLYLSDGTVRNYTSLIIEKLGAENRINAWRIAREMGFINY